MEDCWYCVLRLIDDPRVLRDTYLTCQLFANIYNHQLPHIVKKYTNHLWALLTLFPDANWGWGWRISSNPNITADMLDYYSDEAWNWGMFGLSMNPAITLDFIERFPNKDWDYGWGGWSGNPNITWEFIENNPHLADYWDWGELSMNPGITLEAVKANPKPFGYSWDKCKLNLNPNISQTNISDITWEMIMNDSAVIPIMSNMEIPHNYLSSINLSDITADSLTEFLTREPEYNKFALEFLSLNPTLPWDLVKNNLQFNWDWRALSGNRVITWDIISANPTFPWKMEYVSSNPNLTWEIIYNNQLPLGGTRGKWNWRAISGNSFGK